jgi:4-hydroxy-tetrahydrodipicolinate synthase
MKAITFTGTFTALVTPFVTSGDAVDFAALETLVEAQIEGGVSGLVPCGTTGESPTLTDDEQLSVIKRVVEVAKGRVPVIAGTGSFSTKKTIVASKAALAVGADGVMVVMPYYNKPSQDGLREHVLAIAREVPCPIVLYNIPGRSVVDLSAETTLQICEKAPNVVALKDATGNVLRCQELKRRLGDRLTVLSGDDALTVAFGSVGASGVISVTSNVRPKEVSAVTTALLANDYVRARAYHFALVELHNVMFVEPNPAPAKAGLASMGRMTDTVRLPLVPASGATKQRVVEALAKLDREFPRELASAS